jgi:succinoglycan biosynthesis protein ExoM
LSGGPTASVVICTYNRPALLAASLRSCLADATRRGLAFEIIVADNSVAAHAAGIVAALPPGGAPVRVVAVSPPNISLARNAGLRAAAAPLVAFMDDDLELAPGWLDALVAVLERTGADAAIGPVRPRFPDGTAPDWDPDGARFTRTLDVASGTRLYAGGTERLAGFALSTASSLWRAATCFTDVAPFDPVFGACGGEDLDLFLRLERRGCCFVWCAEAEVRETILPGRMEAGYHVLRAFSGAQVYAAATVKNAAHPVRATIGIGLRGLAQAAVFGAMYVPLGAMRRLRLGGARVERVATRAALAAAAGWGKVTWRQRVALYHVERPPA